jgi:hypothetical protein
MTAQKHFKQLVRARMKKTGESYATARRQILREAKRPIDPAARSHFPGNVPATTALRVLLTHAGVRAPHTHEPFSEAMLFGIAGGIGVGVFSFVYEKENFASFFLAGRHLLHDDLEYLRQTCRRFGITPTVRESGGAKAAAKHLTECLADGPCVAWVDLAYLPHRAAPVALSGGGYHVVTVYRVDEAAGSALIGDLADEPVSIPLPDLSQARQRIGKQKNRLLSIPPSTKSPDLAGLVREGLRSCHRGLSGEGGKGGVWMANFSLEALQRWAERLDDTKDKESWQRVFTPGPRLWNGLTSIYNYIEHYGSGGGLCRPIFADFLTEAAQTLDRPVLFDLAERYAKLGREWSALADAALPDEVPAFREAKELIDRRSELMFGGAPADSVRDVWRQLGELAAGARKQFPLSDAGCTALRARLRDSIAALYDAERDAHAALGEAVESI